MKNLITDKPIWSFFFESQAAVDKFCFISEDVKAFILFALYGEEDTTEYGLITMEKDIVNDSLVIYKTFEEVKNTIPNSSSSYVFTTIKDVIHPDVVTFVVTEDIAMKLKLILEVKFG